MLGFVDDTLSIQKCGNLAIEKNAASNLFVDCTNQKKKKIKPIIFISVIRNFVNRNVLTYLSTKLK